MQKSFFCISAVLYIILQIFIDFSFLRDNLTHGDMLRHHLRSGKESYLPIQLQLALHDEFGNNKQY